MDSAPTLVTSCTALPPEGAGPPWGGPAAGLQHLLGRKGAARIALIPPEVMQALNAGLVPTVNLNEFLAIDLRLLARFAELDGPSRTPSEPLTEREEEVLLTVARGLTNQEIARELHISLSTVKTHVASLREKLDARNRVEVALWAYETKRIAR